MQDATVPATTTDANGITTTGERHEVLHATKKNEPGTKESTRKPTTTTGGVMIAHRKNDHGPNAHGTNTHGTNIHETDGRVTIAELIPSIGPRTRGHGATNVDFHTDASAILSKPGIQTSTRHHSLSVSQT